MSYHPDNNNIQNMIDCNYYSMLDYILKLTPTPFSFDFSTQVDYLFLKGKREMFDLFVSYGFVNEKNFNKSFHSMICYFTEQADLFQHLKNHYKDWFTKANNQYIQPSKIKSFFEFFLTQNNQNTTLEYIIYHIHGLKEFICIEKLIKEEPYFISFVLLKNIKKYNNIELLAHFYQPEFIHNEQILSILDKSLPQLVECDFFNELLDIVFQESSYSSFHNVNKFHSYSKLRKLSHKNPSCKNNKI